MYKAILKNGNEETLIHYPTSDRTAPHLLSLPLEEKLTDPDLLSFSIPYDNPGYNNLVELLTKVKVIDVRDNSVKFIGRVLKIKEGQSERQLIREVLCEEALAFLYDTHMNKEIYINQAVELVISDILTKHNSKVDEDRKIYLGNVTVQGNYSKQFGYDKSLVAVNDIENNLNGQMKIRVSNGITYLDFLSEIETIQNEITLGNNMRDMLKEFDPTEIATRLKGIGKDELTFESINNGVDYVEDTTSPYGIIEDIAEFKDIEDPVELKTLTEDLLEKRKYPKMILEASAIDLSPIREDIDKFKLGTLIKVKNSIMKVDASLKIVEIRTELLEPWNPQLTMSNKFTRMIEKQLDYESASKVVNKITTGTNEVNTYWLGGVINALKNQLVASGSYSNAQVIEDKGLLFENTDQSSPDYGALYIGPGLMAIANSKDENGWSWRSFGTGKGFTADEIVAGILKGIKIEQINVNGNLLAELFTDTQGGVLKVYDNNGLLNAKLGVEAGTQSNVGGTLILYNDSPYESSPFSDPFKRVELGIVSDSGTLNLRDSFGKARVAMHAYHNGAYVGIADEYETLVSYLTQFAGYINNELIATQNWVNSKGFATQSDIENSGFVTSSEVSNMIQTHELMYHTTP